MTSDNNFFTPEQRVTQEVGKILTGHFLFLEELSRKSAALPNNIPTQSDENTPLTNHGKPNNRLNSK